MSQPDTARIFLSVAEDSADVHAASLVRAARERLGSARFYGLTGPRLRDLGVATLFDMTAHAAMLAGVLRILGTARRALAAVEAAWRQHPPDAAVLLDSPELNLRLAALARRLAIPVLYYIAPQTWASREGRNRRIAACVDRLACILPFEQEYFRARGIAAEYVGHPLFEALARVRPDADVVGELRSTGRPLVALLPGSRRHVIEAMLPIQLDVIRGLRAAGRVVDVAISAVSEPRAGQIRSIAARELPDARIVVADNASLLAAADLVLVASGTATLEVAHYRKPMIVVYDAGGLLRPLYSAFGRFVVRTPHLSLVNILARARVVPEFMPFVHDTAPIAEVARQLLDDETWRRLMVRQLDEVIRPLEASNASARVCEILGELLTTAAARTARRAGTEPENRAATVRERAE